MLQYVQKLFNCMHMYRFFIYTKMYRSSPYYLFPESIRFGYGVEFRSNQGELDVFCEV